MKRTDKFVYYTGDMSNQSGTFKITDCYDCDWYGLTAVLTEVMRQGFDDPRVMKVPYSNIGKTWTGSSNKVFIYHDAIQDYLNDADQAKIEGSK